MDTRSDLPEPLAGDARRRWLALSQAADLARVHLPDDAVTVATLQRVLALSDFVFNAFNRNPALLADLTASGDLTAAYPAGTFLRKVAQALDRLPFPAPGETFPGFGIQQALRRVRLREMVRIAVRDLSGRADLAETLNDLSAFADACLDRTLEVLYPWHCRDMGTPMDAGGRPQRMVVFAMGKLGAGELNFSSDIDLVFAYPRAGETAGGRTPVNNADFFSRLGSLLIKMLGEGTPEGRVFRVDMGLRPFGENGPLVLSFDAMESYYQTQGREWERYAWIKARAAAGDKAAGGLLLENLRPFVYRRYLDYGVFDALREMKQKITLEVKKRDMAGNVKMGAGGIREIEFFGQMFQLIRGGVVPELRTRGIQEVLGILAQRGIIQKAVCRRMRSAYVFLRNTENRLQAFSDRQTHDLPRDPDQRLRLAAAMGFQDWWAFKEELDRHMTVVNGHFRRLLESADGADPQPGADAELLEIWKGGTETDAGNQRLTGLGFPDPKKALDLLADLRNAPATRALSPEGRKRLDGLMPLLIRAAGRSENPSRVLNRLVDLIKAIERRTSYLALLLENPSCLSQLVLFADASPWIIGFIAKHPVVLDELLDPRALFRPPEKEDLQRDAAGRLSSVSRDDLELFIEELCVFKQISTLRVAAADVAGHLPLMKVSDRLSWIAETVLDRVVDFAWRDLAAKHGPTDGVPGTGGPLATGFAVAAYGKLGGLELGYASDLDLVFLHAGGTCRTPGSNHPVDTTPFFTRLGQRVVHILTAHTRAGRLYETDMRLRPSGSSGPLVSQIDAFEAYQTEASWTWEHQAIVRARAVCGDPDLMGRFERIRGNVIARKRDRDRLRREVLDMRERLRKEHRTQTAFDPDVFHLKQDPGGMVDIEFLAQYLVLLHAHAHESLTRWSDNVRILESLTETGILDNPTAHLLKRAYLTYRATDHRLSLRDKAAGVSGRRFSDLRRGVMDAWRRYLEG